MYWRVCERVILYIACSSCVLLLLVSHLLVQSHVQESLARIQM